MRNLYLLLVLTLGSLASFALGQCNPTEILPKTAWSIHYVDSEETTGEGSNNGRAIHAIDSNNDTFWHTQWQNAQPPYPHEIQINLGSVKNVAGVKLRSRGNNPFGKPKDYEISTSTDGTNWVKQDIGQFVFPDNNQPGQVATAYFHTVNAQYVGIKFLTPQANYYYTVLSEIDVFEDLACPATGQNNQYGSFEPIPKKYTTDVPFELLAELNSGLPVTFEVVSGPATVSGNLLTLTGSGGQVTVKASQAGNSSYYAWEKTQTFDVVDLSAISPEIETRFTDLKDIKMEELSPYLLYAYAGIDEADQLSITSVEYIVDGESHTAEFSGNAYKYWWTPTQFGTNQVQVKATASNGKTTTRTFNFNVSNNINDITAVTFDGGVIDMGTIGSQWYYGEYLLPQFVGSYDEIIAHFSISCPNVPGGCDDWDRLGWVEIKAPNGQWYELFRYITPYGVPCNTTVDVTDYTSILQGKVEFRMYIETWGTGGWKLDLDLEYKAGTPEYKYSKINELWKGTYPFGDMNNLQPVETAEVEFDEGTLASKMRLVTTGHGWGNNNTSNAAEFYHAYHKIKVNQVNTFDQDLWQTCNPNPDNCTGQMGTWQYNRAGWCPGSKGKLYFYDLTPFVPQGNIDLNYRFQESYRDYCHPNNPDCISGSTCPDCNDGYNPHYRVGGYLIQYSNVPYSLGTEEVNIKDEISAIVYPNPTQNYFNIKLDGNWKNIVVTLYDVTGKSMGSHYFDNESQLNQYLFKIDHFSAGVYFIQIRSEGQFENLRILKK